MMSHISQDKLIAIALDEVELDGADVSHLEECPLCRHGLEAAILLHRELKVAQQSTPSAAALERYVAAFEVALRQTDSLLGRLSQWVQAQLALDSRVTPLAAGVRSGRIGSYRILFTSAYADVEVMVEDDGGLRRLEGEYMEIDERGALPVLVQLQNKASGGLAAEAESDRAGRFWLTGVEPGHYSLILTDQVGEIVEVSKVEIT